jgi:hypothetical protein
MPLTSTAEGSRAIAYIGVATRQQGAWDLQQFKMCGIAAAAAADM